MTGFEHFALAAAAGGSVLNVANTLATGRAEARQAAAQAAFLQNQADYQRRLAESREVSLRRNQSREQARMRALLAGRGIDVASGSALLAQEQAAANAEFEALLLRSTARGEAADTLFRSRQAASRASAARTDAMSRLGSSLLTAGRDLDAFGTAIDLFGTKTRPSATAARRPMRLQPDEAYT